MEIFEDETLDAETAALLDTLAGTTGYCEGSQVRERNDCLASGGAASRWT